LDPRDPDFLDPDECPDIDFDFDPGTQDIDDNIDDNTNDYIMSNYEDYINSNGL
jgi:hypothetical protein